MLENPPVSMGNALSIHAHFKTPARSFSFLLYFTEIKLVEKSAYYLLVALTDNTNKKHYPYSFVSEAAPALALSTLLKTKLIKDNHFNTALKELFSQNKIPLPDQLLKGEMSLDLPNTQFQAASLASLAKRDAGFTLTFVAPDEKIQCHFNLSAPESPEITNETFLGLHNETITLSGALAHTLNGSIVIFDEKLTITNGIISLLKNRIHQPIAAADYGVNQGILHLQDGWSILLHEVINKTTSMPTAKKIIACHNGQQQIITDFELTPVLDKDKQWRSPETFNLYPVHWKLVIPALQLEATIHAEIPEQEIVTLLQPTYLHWQGRCNVHGVLAQKPLRGDAFMARYQFQTVNNVAEFFASVSNEVYKQVAALIPMHPSLAQWRNLISVKADAHILEGIDFDQLAEALIHPIREITDRQGKAWRSYIILACCNAVGGNFRPYLPLLTVELIHVGSLIVDDVEDKSLLRRGGPACHLLYGEPLAINAGEAAYLLPQILFADLFRDLPKEKVCDIYEHYFDAIHAAHAGQALDIAGAEHLVKKVLADEIDPSVFKAQVLAIHRLKSGAPAELLQARVGAILGNATSEQVNQLGNYIECLGTAFQIIDDVLNLRGFKGETKTLGEDLMAGKVTFPVACAAQFMPLEAFKTLLTRIRAQPQDKTEVIQLIALLENSGAIQASADIAAKMIEESWQQLDPLIPDSFTKVMLRVFGRYIIERHY